MQTQSLANHAQLKSKLLETISQFPKGITKNEMVIRSGVNAEIVDYLLRGIIEQYSVHLEVGEIQKYALQLHAEASSQQ